MAIGDFNPAVGWIDTQVCGAPNIGLGPGFFTLVRPDIVAFAADVGGGAPNGQRLFTVSINTTTGAMGAVLDVHEFCPVGVGEWPTTFYISEGIVGVLYYNNAIEFWIETYPVAGDGTIGGLIDSERVEVWGQPSGYGTGVRNFAPNYYFFGSRDAAGNQNLFVVFIASDGTGITVVDKQADGLGAAVNVQNNYSPIAGSIWCGVRNEAIIGKALQMHTFSVEITGITPLVDSAALDAVNNSSSYVTVIKVGPGVVNTCHKITATGNYDFWTVQVSDAGVIGAVIDTAVLNTERKCQVMDIGGGVFQYGAYNKTLKTYSIAPDGDLTGLALIDQSGNAVNYLPFFTYLTGNGPGALYICHDYTVGANSVTIATYFVESDFPGGGIGGAALKKMLAARMI